MAVSEGESAGSGRLKFCLSLEARDHRGRNLRKTPALLRHECAGATPSGRRRTTAVALDRPHWSSDIHFCGTFQEGSGPGPSRQLQRARSDIIKKRLGFVSDAVALATEMLLYRISDRETPRAARSRRGHPVKRHDERACRSLGQPSGGHCGSEVCVGNVRGAGGDRADFRRHAERRHEPAGDETRFPEREVIPCPRRRGRLAPNRL